MNQNKISQNSFDDKRYLWDDGVNSYAYGHHSNHQTKNKKVLYKCV